MTKRVKHRFYFPQVIFHDSPLTINDSTEVHHIKHVLRLGPGDKIRIFNGQGEEAVAQIINIQQRKMTVAIENVHQETAPKPKIILGCAIPKKTKFETVIEKATELGVDNIVPLNTKNTQIKITSELAKKKFKRFEKIAVNAAKQSWRTRLPSIEHITAFQPAVDVLAGQTTMFILSLEKNSKNFLSALRALKKPEAISLLIGPEGDFTKEEYAYARQKGAMPVSLGTTVLKVETAAIAALSCAHVHFHCK